MVTSMSDGTTIRQMIDYLLRKLQKAQRGQEMTRRTPL